MAVLECKVCDAQYAVAIALEKRRFQLLRATRKQGFVTILHAENMKIMNDEGLLHSVSCVRGARWHP